MEEDGLGRSDNATSQRTDILDEPKPVHISSQAAVHISGLVPSLPLRDSAGCKDDGDGVDLECAAVYQLTNATQLLASASVDGKDGGDGVDLECTDVYHVTNSAQLLASSTGMKAEPTQQPSQKPTQQPTQQPTKQPTKQSIASIINLKTICSNKISWSNFQVIFIIINLVLLVCLLVLGISNFKNTESILPSSSSTHAPIFLPKTIQELSDWLDRLKLRLEILTNNSNACSSVHNSSLDNTATQVDILKDIFDNLTDKLTLPTPLTKLGDRSSNCITVEYTCKTNHVQSYVNFTSCITPSFLLSQVESSNYITNMECVMVVDYRIIAPVASTLVVQGRGSNQAWRCRCMGVEFLHSTLIPFGPFDCIMEITMCPKVIPLPLK